MEKYNFIQNSQLQFIKKLKLLFCFLFTMSSLWNVTGYNWSILFKYFDN